MSNKEVKIIECPRDAMQGLAQFIPTKDKIRYLNQLLKVGYHTLDCGSFVSPKAIPQMRDTEEVLNNIELENSNSKLSVIVANQRGVDAAVKMKQVSYLGYPFSVSEQFQQRNTRKSISDSVEIVKYVNDQARENDKQVVIYISMGFGNNYGDPWSSKIVCDWVGELADLGVDYFSISDTVGVGTEETVSEVFSTLIDSFPDVEFGAHFHTRPDEWYEKVHNAYLNGCKRFDGAIAGFGGCPMAEDKLVGNMPTENLIKYFSDQDLDSGIDAEEFKKARLIAGEIFG